MAEMVLAPSHSDGREANFIQKFGRAFAHGDVFTKLSLVVWGFGYIGHGQLIKALLVTLVQGLGLYFLGTSGIPALKKFGTLGTVQMEMQFNPLTLKNEVNNYDNSFAILLLSVIALVVIASLVVATMMVVQSNYLLQQQKAAGKKPNTFRQDITCYLNEKFYVTLLTLPVLGVVVFTIVPLFILIAVAFTNYDQQHMPPASLFTWVGLANFASLFGGQSLSLTFSYAFGKVLSWTLVWAFFATFTNFFGGVFLAMFINNKNTKCPRLWRTLFMITIAVPQFVTLLLVRNFFSDAGKGRKLIQNLSVIVNLFPGVLVMIAVYFVLKYLNLTNSYAGLIMVYAGSSGLGYLICKGFFDTTPVSLREAAKLDGASDARIFFQVVLPMSKPILVYTIISSFMISWTDFVMAKMILNSGLSTDWTVAIGLYNMLQKTLINNYFALFCAGGVFVSIPISVLFVIMQKFYVEGITSGADKG